MSYTSDSDSYDQNVSPYLRRRLRTYEEALSERQAARQAACTTDETMAVSRLATGPASRPAPHDVQSAVVAAQSRTLAGPLAMEEKDDSTRP